MYKLAGNLNQVIISFPKAEKNDATLRPYPSFFMDLYLEDLR
jgi:hypothetical protein